MIYSQGEPSQTNSDDMAYKLLDEKFPLRDQYCSDTENDLQAANKREYIQKFQAKYYFERYGDYIVFNRGELGKSVLQKSKVWAVAIVTKVDEETKEVIDVYWLVWHRGQDDLSTILPMDNYVKNNEYLLEFFEGLREFQWSKLSAAVMSQKTGIHYCYVDEQLKESLPSSVEEIFDLPEDYKEKYRKIEEDNAKKAAEMEAQKTNSFFEGNQQQPQQSGGGCGSQGCGCKEPEDLDHLGEDFEELHQQQSALFNRQQEMQDLKNQKQGGQSGCGGGGMHHHHDHHHGHHNHQEDGCCGSQENHKNSFMHSHQHQHNDMQHSHSHEHHDHHGHHHDFDHHHHHDPHQHEHHDHHHGHNHDHQVHHDAHQHEHGHHHHHQEGGCCGGQGKGQGQMQQGQGSGCCGGGGHHHHHHHDHSNQQPNKFYSQGRDLNDKTEGQQQQQESDGQNQKQQYQQQYEQKQNSSEQSTSADSDDDCCDDKGHFHPQSPWRDHYHRHHQPEYMQSKHYYMPDQSHYHHYYQTFHPQQQSHYGHHLQGSCGKCNQTSIDQYYNFGENECRNDLQYQQQQQQRFYQQSRQGLCCKCSTGGSCCGRCGSHYNNNYGCCKNRGGHYSSGCGSGNCCKSGGGYHRSRGCCNSNSHHGGCCH